MPKTKINPYYCSECGAEYSKWEGRCKSCGSWNAIEEKKIPSADTERKRLIIPLSDIEEDSSPRKSTGIAEFDTVCGGGIVPGSVILIGGEPGIGKSTLALEASRNFRALYVCGEESPAQIKQRAARLGIDGANILVTPSTSTDDIEAMVAVEEPEIIIIDSIQTVTSPASSGLAGSVTQVRESTARLGEIARNKNTPVLLVGHITKDGNIAGPKILEHMVDTVLYFEGDFTREFRVLRAFKNRYGSVNEIGVFTMTPEGLKEVTDRNGVFLAHTDTVSPGSAVSAAIEGSRAILFEIQSLVVHTSFPNPRRMADGFDLNRLILIIAVLEKHQKIRLSASDVFVNVAGGFNISETASDLGVAVSIASSYFDSPVRGKTGFLGEISLSGEIRPVSQADRRAAEFSRNGFDTLFVPEKDRVSAEGTFKGRVKPVRTISEVIIMLFGSVEK